MNTFSIIILYILIIISTLLLIKSNKKCEKIWNNVYKKQIKKIK
jgi:hypothetical protein